MMNQRKECESERATKGKFEPNYVRIEANKANVSMLQSEEEENEEAGWWELGS